MIVDALLDSSGWAGIDVVKILGYGVLGLGFLLALLAYRLLSKEQGKQTPHPDAFRAIYVFMGFSLALCILGLVSQFFDGQAAGQKDGQAAGQKSDAFMGTVANDATQLSVASAVQPYPEMGYPNDADKLEALMQEFLAHALLHPDVSFVSTRPFYLAMDQAVNGFEQRAQQNIHNDPNLQWHSHDSPEWFRTHLNELRADHESAEANLPADTIRKYQRIFHDWRLGVGIGSHLAS
jgi:hypothetical protein